MTENKKECGLIFNRHNWVTIGRTSNCHLFQSCSKCGETIESYPVGASIHTVTITFQDAINRIRNNDKLEDSRQQALTYLKNRR